MNTIQENVTGKAGGMPSIVPPQAVDAPIVVGVRQAMVMLKVARAKLYRMINTGQVESYMHDGSRRILVSSIHQFIEKRLEEARAERKAA